MPMINARLTPLLPAVIAALAAVGCGSQATDATVPAGEPLKVSTVTVTDADAVERQEAGGTVTAAERVSLTSRLVAAITDVRVRSGDRVRAGQVLVVLDDRDLAAQVRQSSAASAAAEQSVAAGRADLVAAEADQKLAAAWYARMSTLRARNAASTQEFDEAEARRAAADARVTAVTARLAQFTAAVDGSRASAEAATTTRSFGTLTAPFDGVVAERLVDPGAIASPGVPLLRLEAAGNARVTAQVDESRLRFVRPGTRVAVLVGAAGAGSSSGAIDGVVMEVARVAGANQQSFTVTVSLPRGADVSPGAFARVRFGGAARRVLAVPARAVRRQGQVATVFVVTDGVARMRLVQVAGLDESRVEVVAGLAAGEVIVDSPPPALADGRRVVAADEARP
jgi:RND family efflux transporter MFP subunit